MNEVCFSKAQHLVDIIAAVDKGLLSKPLERTNILKQKADECTEMFMHYFELEVRASAGEGWGATKTLHPEHRRQIRNALKLWSMNLEQVRLKWQEAEKASSTKKKVLSQWVQLQIGEIAKADVELDKLYEVAAKVAQLLSKHSDLPGFVLPKRLPKPKAKSKPKAKPTAKALQSAEAVASEPATEASEPAVEASEPVAAQPEAAVAEPLGAVEPTVAAQPEAAVAVETEAAQPEAAQPEAAVAVEPEADQPEAAVAISPEAWLQGSKPITIVLLDEDKAEVEAKLAELSAGEIAYKEWRDRLSTAQKLMIIDEWYAKAENYNSLKKMVELVKSKQTLGTCSKCRWGELGCERCNYEQSLNYVLRWGHVASWFKARLWI